MRVLFADFLAGVSKRELAEPYGISFGAGKGVPGLSESGRRPWKRRRAWKRSREELPSVWGAERADSGGGNWGGPPRPGDLRNVSLERGVL